MHISEGIKLLNHICYLHVIPSALNRSLNVTIQILSRESFYTQYMFSNFTVTVTAESQTEVCKNHVFSFIGLLHSTAVTFDWLWLYFGRKTIHYMKNIPRNSVWWYYISTDLAHVPLLILFVLNICSSIIAVFCNLWWDYLWKSESGILKKKARAW